HRISLCSQDLNPQIWWLSPFTSQCPPRVPSICSMGNHCSSNTFDLLIEFPLPAQRRVSGSLKQFDGTEMFWDSCNVRPRCVSQSHDNSPSTPNSRIAQSGG